MTLRRIPKPTPKPILDEYEVVLHSKGGHGAIKALVNHLHQIGFVTTEKYILRADGRVEQTIHIQVREVAKRYEDRPEQAYIDKSGDLYVFQSLENADKYKVGISIHVPIRVKQVSRTFEEPFKRIYSVHCTDAKARETWVHHQLRAMGAQDVGHEQFILKEKHLEFLFSLENE